MALFKIFKGLKDNLPLSYKDGYCYFTIDDGKMYIDTDNTMNGRVCLKAEKADILATARTITLSGDVSGSASFDGSKDIVIDTSIINNKDTWKENSINSEGYVLATNGQSNKVWKTDANGNPGWREDSNTTYAVVTATTDGLMSYNDKKVLNSIKGGDVYLSGVPGNNITYLKSTLDNWLSENTKINSASAYFSANQHWISLWNNNDTTTMISDGTWWTVTVVGMHNSKNYVQLKFVSYIDKAIYYCIKTNGNYGLVHQITFTDDTLFTKRRDGTASYNNLASYYTGSTVPTYYRVTIPSGTKSYYTMITMELSLRANYSNETGGKILINAHHSSSSTVWSPINATVLGYLPYTIKVYASDNYFYIEGGAAWGTISVDKVFYGDTSSGHDQSNTSIDVVTELPSSYQTATMFYGLHSGNYTSHISPSAIGAVPLSGGTMTGALVTTSLTTPVLWMERNSVNSNITAQNSNYLHYTTDASAGHWFNKDIYVKGDIFAGSSYGNKVLHDGNYSSTLDSRYAKIASGNNFIHNGNEITMVPSGYSNDVWFNYRTLGGNNGSIGTYNFGNGAGTWAQIKGSKVHGAVWNDYAEYRNQKEEIEPGYCVYSANNGQVSITTEMYQACDGIVSDTFGFSIGETDECKTPLAVAGRVLAYCAGNRYDYNAGDTVCAGPGGLVYKMTREEIKEYPDRIVGIVSEIPEYEVWGAGEVEVDGRIWIKVK